MYFLDNLRAFVVLLVIVLHGSITYMAYAPAWWYVLDPKNSELFTWVVLLVDVPIMPMLFFIAGYFALPSLQKKGSRQLMHVFMLVLLVGWGAFLAYTIFRFRARPGHAADYHGIRTTGSTYIEAAVAVVEVFFLVGLSIPV